MKEKEKNEKDQFNKIIGKKIQHLRRKQNMTQQNLAEKIGVSYKQVNMWENGKVSIPLHRIFQICVCLQSTMSQFFADMDFSSISEKN